MPKDKDHDASLSDDQTFSGKFDDVDDRSLGDQATFAGGFAQRDTQSLGDQATLGGTHAGDDDLIDSDGENTALAARYKAKGAMTRGRTRDAFLAVSTSLERKVAIKRWIGLPTRSTAMLNRDYWDGLRDSEVQMNADAALGHFFEEVTL